MEQQVESNQRLDSNQGDLSGRTQLPITFILSALAPRHGMTVFSFYLWREGFRGERRAATAIIPRQPPA